MKRSTLIFLNVMFYSIWALAGSWTTTMAGVHWENMGWEEKSCVIMGILLGWSATMKALFDNSIDIKGNGGNITKS